MEITRCNFNYAVFIPKPDRRQQNKAVDVERRSGGDRRTAPRYILAPGQNVSGVDPNTQFVQQADRRQQNKPVEVERRSGGDRRKDLRFVPLSFGKEDADVGKVKEIYLGKVAPAGFDALNDENVNKTANKLKPALLDTFVHSGKTKSIISGLNTKLKYNISSSTLKKNKSGRINFLAKSGHALKKTVGVFLELAIILINSESLKKIIKNE